MPVPNPLWLIPMLFLAAGPALADSPPMVGFASGSARLTPRDEAVLDAAIPWLRAAGAESVYIDGYADRAGSARANLRLSRRRAEAVRASLIRRGFPADRIEIRAFGETRPLIETADGIPEPQNRYAIILINRMSPPTG
jgi:OOP family OmpA-OmpF porin